MVGPVILKFILQPNNTGYKMARTRVKSSNIENISISAEDIAADSITSDKIAGIDATKLVGTVSNSVLPEISGANISANSITNDKIVTVDASKLTGTVDSSNLPNPLPALDGSALTNITTTGVADNSVSLDKLNTVNAGTQGQLLSFDSSQLRFIDSPISLDDQSVTSAKMAPTGTFPAWDASQLINLPETGLNSADISNSSVGGDVSGTVSNISIDVVDSENIVSLNANKLTGTLPSNVINTSATGELGFLNKSSWADDETVTINFNTNSSAAGKSVVKIYEEISGSGGASLTNSNSWDISTNDTGFDLNNYTYDSASVTPSAISGSDINFTFSNFGSGFSAGAYTSGIGYTIKNTIGNGIAKIDSTNGLVASCTIVEDFSSVNTLGPGEFTLTAGEFTNGNFELSTSGGTDPIDQFQYGNNSMDIGGNAENINIEDGFCKMLKIHDQTPNSGLRAVRIWSRTGADSFQGGNAHEYTMRIIEVDPDFVQSSHSKGHFYTATNINSRYPLEKNNDMSELDMGMAGGGGDQRRVLLVGRDSNGRCKLKTYKIPAGYPAPLPDETPQTLTFDQEEFISDSGSVTRDVKIHVHTASTIIFYVIWQQQVTFAEGSTGFVSYGKCGSIDPSSGAVAMGTQHLLLDTGSGNSQNPSSIPEFQYITPTAAGQVNSPLLHFFRPLYQGINTFPKDFYFCYIYYRDSGSPYAILGKLGVPGLDSTFVNSTYTRVYEASPNQGCFRDSNNSFQPNDGPGNRLSKGHNAGFTNTDLTEQDHAIHYLGVNDAAYVWRSTLGLEACVVSLFPDVGGSDGTVSQSFLPLYFGEYSQNQSNSIKGGSAQNFDGAVATETTSFPLSAIPNDGTNPIQVGSVDIAYSNAYPAGGFYQYAELSGFIPINNTLGENGAPLTGFGIEHGQSRSYVYYGSFEFNSSLKTLARHSSHTSIRDYTVSGNINNLVSTNGTQFAGDDERLFTAYHNGDNNMYAKVHTYEYPSQAGVAVLGEWITTFSGTDSLNTSNYDDISSIVVTQSGQENDISYCFSTDFDQDNNGLVTGGTFFVRKEFEADGSTVVTSIRNIISSRNSIHGGTDGDWYCNNSSQYTNEDWLLVSGSTGPGGDHNVTVNVAMTKSLTSFGSGQNKMTKSSVENLTTGDFPELSSKLAVGIGIIHIASSDPVPTVDKLVVSYSTSAKHRDRTHEYTIVLLNTSSVEVTAPSSGGPRNARVYITS